MKLRIASLGLAAGLVLHLCGQNVQAALAGTTYDIAEVQGTNVVQDVWVFGTDNTVTGNTSAGTYTMVVDLGMIGVWNATLTDNTSPSLTTTVSGIQFNNFLIGYGKTTGSGSSGGSGGDGGDDDQGEDNNSKKGGGGNIHGQGKANFLLIGQQQTTTPTP